MGGNNRLDRAVSARMITIAIMAVNGLSLVVRHYNLYKCQLGLNIFNFFVIKNLPIFNKKYY